MPNYAESHLLGDQKIVISAARQLNQQLGLNFIGESEKYIFFGIDDGAHSYSEIGLPQPAYTGTQAD